MRSLGEVWLGVLLGAMPAFPLAQTPPEPQAGTGAAESAPRPPDGQRCSLFRPGAEATASSDCVACHDSARGASAMRMSHAVGVDYAAAQARRRGSLRELEEVARRGVRLPNGKVECVTCHDAASPWAGRVALPPGSVAIPRSDPGYETAEGGRNWRTADKSTPPPPAGSAVVSAPLCAACHTMAD